MALYSFDSTFHSYSNGLTTPTAAAGAAASAIQIEEYYHADETMSLQQTIDADTYGNAALTQMNSIIPTPGNGTNLPGDTPKAFLFLITDGVEDENQGGSNGVGLISTDQCTAMKNRGVSIGVVYTTYFPGPDVLALQRLRGSRSPRKSARTCKAAPRRRTTSSRSTPTATSAPR